MADIPMGGSSPPRHTDGAGKRPSHGTRLNSKSNEKEKEKEKRPVAGSSTHSASRAHLVEEDVRAASRSNYSPTLPIQRVSSNSSTRVSSDNRVASILGVAEPRERPRSPPTTLARTYNSHYESSTGRTNYDERGLSRGRHSPEFRANLRNPRDSLDFEDDDTPRNTHAYSFGSQPTYYPASPSDYRSHRQPEIPNSSTSHTGRNPGRYSNEPILHAEDPRNDDPLVNPAYGPSAARRPPDDRSMYAQRPRPGYTENTRLPDPRREPSDYSYLPVDSRYTERRDIPPYVAPGPIVHPPAARPYSYGPRSYPTAEESRDPLYPPAPYPPTYTEGRGIYGDRDRDGDRDMERHGREHGRGHGHGHWGDERDREMDIDGETSRGRHSWGRRSPTPPQPPPPNRFPERDRGCPHGHIVRRYCDHCRWEDEEDRRRWADEDRRRREGLGFRG